MEAMKMETSKIRESNVSLHKIELNSEGDHIVLSGDNAGLFDKFVNGYRKIMDYVDQLPEKIEQIEKKYEGRTDIDSSTNRIIEISKINVGFSEYAISVIDNIFGAGTVQKYFRAVYEEVPDFIPDSECITDFFEQITPEMEKLFDRKLEKDEKARKTRMEKYKPQDHKRPARKSGVKK